MIKFKSKTYSTVINKMVGNWWQGILGYSVISEEEVVIGSRSVGKTVFLGLIFLPLALFGNTQKTLYKVNYQLKTNS